MEVKKIRKEGDQKKITIPKKSDLQIGDYVAIEKIFPKRKEVEDESK